MSKLVNSFMPNSESDNFLGKGKKAKIKRAARATVKKSAESKGFIKQAIVKDIKPVSLIKSNPVKDRIQAPDRVSEAQASTPVNEWKETGAKELERVEVVGVRKNKAEEKNNTLLYLGLALAAVILLIILKNKK